MDTTPRTSRMRVRRLAMMAALAALLVPAGPAEAAKKKKVKVPVVTSVSPLKAEIGTVLTLKGKNFRRGKRKNSVAFKSDGAPAVFARSDISTTKMMKVKVPARLQQHMANVGNDKVATRFRLRVLAKRFAKRYTRPSLSPLIGPKGTAPESKPPAAAAADGDCDNDGITNGNESDDDNDGLSDDVELSLALDPCKPDTDGDGVGDKYEYDCDRDGVLNRDELDDDNDLLPDDLENTIGTSGCSADSDGDNVGDAYEYRSAVDLNDDDYRSPQVSLPYPGKRPYPNPLFADADLDHDGDGLTLGVEQELWLFTWAGAKPTNVDKLSYSAGEQYSRAVRGDDGRRKPTQAAAGYDKFAAFTAWAEAHGYKSVSLEDRGFDDGDGYGWDGFTEGLHQYDILDVNRNGAVEPIEATPLDRRFPDGFLSDDELDEDADGLSNYDETRGRLQDTYWAACYSAEPVYWVPYAGTSAVDPDSDGDSVLDGADDQDHDDVPNVMELSRWDASGLDDSDDKIKGMVTGGGRSCTPDEDLKPEDPWHTEKFGQVNPFNPCMPDRRSRTCPKVIPFDPPAPFTGPDWWALQ